MARMKKFGRELGHLMGEIGEDSSANRKQMRALQVRERYRKVVEVSYPQSSQLILDHTNAVYILKKEGVKTLIVYVDESIFAAELNARRELMKLKLKELFGEEVEQFEIHVSRRNYKDQHPFKRDSSDNQAPIKRELNEQEKKTIEEVVKSVENEQLKRALEKAMTAKMTQEMQ